jgi:phosphoglycolate phosphatase
MNDPRPEDALVIAANGFAGNAGLPRGFNWRAFDAYLFDIDGTLLNLRDAVHYNAFLIAMREVYGRAVSLEGVILYGSTDPLILISALNRAGIPESDARAALPEAISRMCSEVETRSAELRPELCPAVLQLLTELRSAGKLIGVASGNLERIGWAKLKAAGIAEFFSFGSFSNRNESRTEIFRWGAQQAQQLCGSARVCFLGDTPADVAAAKSCGFPVIAVATGIHSLLELARSEPEMCIPACETLWTYAR